MSLENTINSDIKAAMLAKDKKKLESLRAVKAAILLAKTEKSASTELGDDAEIKILQRLVKQRKDSGELYKSQGREDLAEDEFSQVAYIEKYLPQQMDESEVRNVIAEIISTTSAAGMKDMGKVMGIATTKLAGQAENKLVATIVRELLNK